MKQVKLFLSVIGIMMLLSFVTTMTASAYDLQVSQDKDGYYWGTSPEGTKIGCRVDATQYWDENGYPYYDAPFSAYVNEIRDIKGETLTLPESITVKSSNDYTSLVDQKLSITSAYIGIYDNNVHELNVPTNYTELGISGQVKGNVVFFSTVPLNLSFNVDPSLTRCIVPASAYDTYKQACAENSNGWNSEINLVPDNYRDKSHPVNVTEAGTLKDELLAKCSSFDNVYNLTIEGNINSWDLDMLQELKNLTTLDLSDTRIEIMGSSYKRYFLETVILPTTITEIDESAFKECYNLKSINTDNVVTIGSDAFHNAYSLKSINLNNVETIGSNAFNSCNLESITGDKVKNIGDGAFSGCRSLKSIDFPNVNSIGNMAFSNTALKEFHIYDNVYYAPYCIYDSEIEKIYFHTNKTFDYLNDLPYLTDVYLYDPVPGNVTRDNTQKIPRLHVPGFSYDSYVNNRTYQKAFNAVLKLNEDLTRLDVYKDLAINSNESLGNKFDLTLLPPYYSSDNTVALDNNAPNPLVVKDFKQYYYLSSYSENYTTHYTPLTTFINNGTVTADNVKVVMDLRNSKDLWGESGWNFISFPFDVDIQNIITPSEALWVIREYNGEIRASRSSEGETANTQSAWLNVTNPAVLEAGKGYILHFSSNFGNQFTFPAVDNENKNKIFNNNDVEVPLDYYPAQFAHDDSWNLIGNPFDACFDSHQISDSNSPSQVITVWRSNERTYTYDENGNQYERYGTYESFSLVDDDYVLTPFEAFFVQATGKNTKLTFHKEGRQHSIYEKKNQHHAPKRMVASNADRSIINLHIDGNGCSDRTRLVINEDASTNYEIGCDASKFLSYDESVPQIFMVQDGQNLAINERPMGTGIFRVGTVFGIDGDYTITSDIRNANYSVILCDAETGNETDITESGYTFNAKKGSDKNRFSIRLKVGESGISDVKADNFNVTLNAGNLSVTADGEISIYTIDGKLVASGNDNLETSVSKGIYVVKAAGKTKKVTY